MNLEARHVLSSVLDGIGTGETIEQQTGEFTLHQRRSLSDAEISMLTAEWLAIPAQDEFSADGQIEMKL